MDDLLAHLELIEEGVPREELDAWLASFGLET